MKKITYMLVLLMMSAVFSAEDCGKDAGTTIGGAPVGALTSMASKLIVESCPRGHDISKLQGICGVVGDRTRAPAGSGYRFEYEKMVNEAACVTASDDDLTKKKKIQDLWNSHQEKFRCSSSDFEVSEGTLLKYSISSRSFNFINSAITKWNLNLNYIDPSDNKTILDYVKRQIEVNRGSEIEPQLLEYFEVLRKSGAKFRSELI